MVIGGWMIWEEVWNHGRARPANLGLHERQPSGGREVYDKNRAGSETGVLIRRSTIYGKHISVQRRRRWRVAETAQGDRTGGGAMVETILADRSPLFVRRRTRSSDRGLVYHRRADAGQPIYHTV